MVSVLVAVYNVEDYLPRCLDSVLSQTYHDLEIILVDDGSTDSSGSICEEYAERDERVKVIHQANEGLSSARNTGLRAATGDYILMIDGDDALHPQMIEILYKLITSGDYDFSMCYGEIVYDINVLNIKYNELYDNDSLIELSPDICMKNMYIGSPWIHCFYSVVWNKLYKKELIDNCYFKRLPSNDVLQDLNFNTRIYQQITKAILIPSNLYYYIQRSSSFQHLGISLRIVNSISSHYICLNEIPIEKKQYRAWCMMSLYRRMYLIRYRTRNTIYEKRAYENCSYVRKNTIREFLGNMYIPFVKKCKLLLFNYCPCLFSRVINIGEWMVKVKKRFRYN